MFRYTCIILLLAYFQTAKNFAQKPFFPTLIKNQWVYLDVNGNHTLSLDTNQYAKPHVFCEGKAAVFDKKTASYGYINEKGKWTISPQFTFADAFNEGLAVVGLPCDENCLTEGNGLLLFGYTAVIDEKGKIVLRDNAQDPEVYKRFWFDHYNEKGLFRVVHGISVGDIKTLMNHKGEMLGIRSGMCCLYASDEVVVYNTYEGNYYTDLQGNVIQKLPEGYISAYKNGYAWLEDTDGEGTKKLLNKKGEVVLTLSGDSFALVKDVGENCFAALKNETYQFYDLTGKGLINKTFSDAGCFSNRLCYVETPTQHGYINLKGEMAITLPDVDCTECEYGEFNKEGYALIYQYNTDISQNEAIALVLKNGKVFWKMAQLDE